MAYKVTESFNGVLRGKSSAQLHRDLLGLAQDIGKGASLVADMVGGKTQSRFRDARLQSLALDAGIYLAVFDEWKRRTLVEM